jgi:hypothetical protein
MDNLPVSQPVANFCTKIDVAAHMEQRAAKMTAGVEQNPSTPHQRTGDESR